MANAITIPPPKGATYTTDARDERHETDPSSPLTLRELSDLKWFFCEAMSDMGVRSTFGEQLERALGQRAGADALREARTRRRLISKIHKGWRPSKSTMTKHGLDEVAILFPGAFIDPDGNFQLRAIESELSDQTIYMRSPIHSAPPDPYEDDHVLVLVRKANAIRVRLQTVGENHTKVLNATYGPVVNGDGHAAMRKRFGDLTEIVVAIVASQRSSADPPSRAIIRAKLSDDSFVRMLKHGAGGYLRAACSAYAGTRQ